MDHNEDVFAPLDATVANAGHPLAGCLVPETYRVGVIPADTVHAMGLEFDSGRQYVAVHADFVGPVVGIAEQGFSRVFWTVPALAEFWAGVTVMLEAGGQGITFQAELDRAMMDARKVHGQQQGGN